MTDEPQINSDPVPERARIEASPPAKRLDALPVLYLVGFLILASALIYLWQHPTLPRSAALQAARVDTMREQIDTLAGQVKGLQARTIPEIGPLEARIAALEHRPEVASSLAPGVLAPLEARVAAVEARPVPAPSDLKPIEDRIAALEKRPPVDLQPLDARIAALEGRPPVDLRPLVARVTAIETKPPVDLGPLTQRVDGLTKKGSDDLAALGTQLGTRLDALDAATKQNAAGLAAAQERAQLAGRLQAMSAALAAGQRLGDVPGAPPALARFAHDTPPTEAGLRLSFDQAAAAAHDASQPDITRDKPFLDRVWARAQQSVTVRQGDKILVGDPIGGIIELARKDLDAGDLQGAVTALQALAGPAKSAMAGWVGQAQSLLDARAAIGALASRG